MIRLAHPNLNDSDIEACARVLRSGSLVHGAHCAAFEKELAAFLKARHVRIVSSGTAALHCALLAHGVGPGDAVLISDFTFPASFNTVERVGARPVPVDVDPRTYNMSPDALLKTLSAWPYDERPRAVMPVHQFGLAADVGEIGRVAGAHSLAVIHDAACALGARFGERRLGSEGTVCFSFHPRKSLTTGDGGAVALDDDALAERVSLFRNHGMQDLEDGIGFVEAGLNYRLTDFQAALGRGQLERLEERLSRCAVLAGRYFRALADSPFGLPLEAEGRTWQTFMITLPEAIDRGLVMREMRKKGIESNRGAYAVHALDYYRRRYPGYAALMTDARSLHLDRCGLALPLHGAMTDGDIDTVAGNLLRTIEEVGG